MAREASTAIKYSSKFRTCFGKSCVTKEENLRCANVSVRFVYLLLPNIHGLYGCKLYKDKPKTKLESEIQIESKKILITTLLKLRYLCLLYRKLEQIHTLSIFWLWHFHCRQVNDILRNLGSLFFKL